ncbi:macrophage mannose receptor 1-like [Notolabrus celidotus]|uniref:macrophage mannose receptor 1-like n=1 Tax=Notolabrus celidotus TaxID=1203425 RepID=UPI00148FA5C7|nr:macrophage mannose receptor 1-like [Notolabrus celidotus]
MDRIHLLLLLSGLCSLSSCVIHYELSQHTNTWYEARIYCREKLGDLATIEDMAQMQNALEAVGGRHENGVWIGLHKGKHLKWHWSLEQKDFYKKGEKGYIKWKHYDANNCGSFKYGLFYTDSCTTLYYAVCFDETKNGPEQYRLTSKRISWMSAREHCRTHFTDLTSVRNEEESKILQELIGDEQVWTGLFRDPWEWSDGNSSSLRHWTADQVVHTDISVKECVNVRNDGRWEPQECTNPHRFLCAYEKTFKHVYKVKISLNESGLDLNVPAVKEDILKHIKQQLNGTGITSIQWRTQPDGRVFIKEPEKNQTSSTDCKP